MDEQKFNLMLTLLERFGFFQTDKKEQEQKTEQFDNCYDLLLGKYVISRHHKQGTSAGVLIKHSKDSFVLADCRQLWKWSSKNISLFGVAEEGLSGDDDWIKVSHALKMVIIPKKEMCSLILCSEDAEKSIRGYKSYVQP